MNKSDAVVREVKQLRSLDEVFKWAQTPRFLPDDVVIQDEYTHDILLRAPDDSFLILDAT